MNPTYGTLNGTVADIIARMNAAGAAVDASLQPVFFIVGCLLLVFACSKFMWQRDLRPLAAFVIQFCTLMVIIWASSRWVPLTDGYMDRMGGYGASIGGAAIDQISPAKVMVRGLAMAERLYTENVSWLRLVFGSSDDFFANVILLVVCVLTILVSLAMAVIIMTFYALMKLASIVALVFLAFVLFDATRFMGAPGLARIMAYGVQMLVMSLVAGMYYAVMDALQLDGRLRVDQAISTLAIVLFFAYLFWNTTSIAREQISGMPVLSLTEPAAAMGRGAMAAAGMLPGAARATMGALGGAGASGPSMPSMSSSTSAGRSAGGGGYAMSSAGGRAVAQRDALAGAPRSVQRMLADPKIIDGHWTEARDLGPKAAQRMLAKADGPRRLPPPKDG